MKAWVEGKLGETLPLDLWEVVCTSIQLLVEHDSLLCPCVIECAECDTVTEAYHHPLMHCLWQWSHDGKRLCKLANILRPGTVDMGMVTHRFSFIFLTWC